jgi:hypothetical protein
MVIHIPKQLEVAIDDQAKRRGVSPETLALEAIRERFQLKVPTEAEHEAWKRKLSEAASDCGVALTNEALSSEGLYE